MRMVGGRAQIVVDAPVDKVFSYVADFTRHWEWYPHSLSLRQTSEGPVGVGSTFSAGAQHSIGYGSSISTESTVQVTEFVPNERMVWELDEQGAFARGARHRSSIDVEPGNGGTRTTFQWERTSFSLVEKLIILPGILVVFPLARLLTRWTVRRSVRELKERMEREERKRELWEKHRQRERERGLRDD